MKLMYCPHCQDVVALRLTIRSCECGKVRGWYLNDGYHAQVSKEAISLGFANSSFVPALVNQPEDGLGKSFEAFVIPKRAKTIKVGFKEE